MPLLQVQIATQAPKGGSLALFYLLYITWYPIDCVVNIAHVWRNIAGYRRGSGVMHGG